MNDFEKLDHYELLGVSRSATADEIKRAYRREISKYHPDRFVGGTPEQQAYAQLRSQRLTEAYDILSDFKTRTAYNRGQSADLQINAARPPAQQHRDHQAELYDQAHTHFENGRLLQAIGALRQLQQINPFYRDSAELLATAEAELNRRSGQASRRLPRTFVAFGALFAGLLVVALAAWVLTSRNATASLNSLGVSASPAPTAQPTTPPAPVAAAAQPTAQPTPEAQPTEAPAEPTAAPTTEPAQAPTEAPTAAPTETPATQPTDLPNTSAAESGTVLLRENFASGGWADINRGIWQVGYTRGRYRIYGDTNTGAIWSYRTAPAADASIGVDVAVSSGEGGLLVHFVDDANYTSITLNPSQTSFRVEQHVGGATNVLAGGQSEAINAGDSSANRLVARLSGQRIQVLVNGQQLADVSEQSNTDSTRYGLLVIAKDSPSEAYFDNLVIRQIDN